ncbi:uncharacterized protein LOC113464430 isoform X1 [Ceratina calcarata]|uniref:Uncharacterized protein LOC113464430 isoform X1 n=1 Tax=Ceratina calcarata TaxID=156304 RepID=A0AAJ7WC25_9HYME|nr:uncharacterized protein LOC113464430 isoform X1 [Ceratina calcarata]
MKFTWQQFVRSMPGKPIESDTRKKLLLPAPQRIPALRSLRKITKPRCALFFYVAIYIHPEMPNIYYSYSASTRSDVYRYKGKYVHLTSAYLHNVSVKVFYGSFKMCLTADAVFQWLELVKHPKKLIIKKVSTYKVKSKNLLFCY